MYIPHRGETRLLIIYKPQVARMLNEQDPLVCPPLVVEDVQESAFHPPGWEAMVCRRFVEHISMI